MKIFADTADIAAIERLAQSGLIDGVTTNLKLFARGDRPFLAVITEMSYCQIWCFGIVMRRPDLDLMV